MNGSTRRASVLAFVAVSVVTVFTTVERQASMTVEPRGWAGLVTYPAARPNPRIDSLQDHTNAQYWIPLPNGLDSFPDGWAGWYQFGYDYSIALGLGTGINHLWMYYKRPPSFLTPVVWMSVGLYPGHPAYDAQDINQSRQRPPNSPLQRFCTRADVNKLRQEVMWHEGVEVGWPKSHHATFASYFAAHDPALIFEQATFHVPDTSTTPTINTLRRAATDAAGYAQAVRNDSLVVHAVGNLIPRPNCKLRLPP